MAITAGAGTSIGSDDISSVQYQRVKLIHGVDGTNDGDVALTNPLPVEMSQSQSWFTIDVPGSVAGAYAVGDQFGTIITITNAARASGGTGWITSVILNDNDNVQGGMDIAFFHDTVTLAADNAAYTIASDTDARKQLYHANIPYFTNNGANRMGQLPGIAVPYFCTGTSLYAAVIVRVAATTTANAGLQFRVGLTRD